MTGLEFLHAGLTLPSALDCDDCGARVETTRAGLRIESMGGNLPALVTCPECAALDDQRRDVMGAARFLVQLARPALELPDGVDLMGAMGAVLAAEGRAQ